MIRKMVHYKVRRDKLDVVQKAIAEFVMAIASREPKTVYEAFQRVDEVSFVHYMSFPDETAENNHQTAVYTKQFADVLYPNCELPPVFTDLKLIKSTRPS